MLLLLVEDLYEQRHPPFKMTLRNKNPVVAQLCAEAMLAWAQAGQHAPTTTTDRSELERHRVLLSLRPKKRNGSGCGKRRVAKLILKRRR